MAIKYRYTPTGEWLTLPGVKGDKGDAGYSIYQAGSALSYEGDLYTYSRIDIILPTGYAVRVGDLLATADSRLCRVEELHTEHVVAIQIAYLKGEPGTAGSPGAKGDKGDKGDSYVLTAADKNDIAEIVASSFADGNEVSY